MTEQWTAEDYKAHLAGKPVTKAPATKQRPKFKNQRIGRQFGGKRHTPGVMNKTEERYAALLEDRKKRGEVIEWLFESVTFKLATDCRFTPDFMVILANGEIEFIDAKGSGMVDDKSIVKIRVAAEKFADFRFVVEKERRKKDGGGWKRTEY